MPQTLSSRQLKTLVQAEVRRLQEASRQRSLRSRSSASLFNEANEA